MPVRLTVGCGLISAACSTRPPGYRGVLQIIGVRSTYCLASEASADGGDMGVLCTFMLHSYFLHGIDLAIVVRSTITIWHLGWCPLVGLSCCCSKFIYLSIYLIMYCEHAILQYICEILIKRYKKCMYNQGVI